MIVTWNRDSKHNVAVRCIQGRFQQCYQQKKFGQNKGQTIRSVDRYDGK